LTANTQHVKLSSQQARDTMRLSIDEAVAFIKFVRHADHEEQLDYIECYGGGDTFGSLDESGEDPYYEWVTLSFTDEKGEEYEITFSDTTCTLVREALWKMVEVLDAGLL
jgi:hypothetical protein